MKLVTAKDNNGNNSSGFYYGMYVLSMLLFGTNGYLVSHISLQSSQIVLVRTDCSCENADRRYFVVCNGPAAKRFYV